MIKLNIGCGKDYREGYVNIDSGNVKKECYMNLEDGISFSDDSVDEILAYHVLEHITNFKQLVFELHRVCKRNAIIKIKVPFYSSWGQYNDPTHIRFFTPFTFNYFNGGTYGHEVGSDKTMFEIKSHINFGIGKSRIFNFLNPIINLFPRIYCRFFAWILPASEIQFELKVIK